MQGYLCAKITFYCSFSVYCNFRKEIEKNSDILNITTIDLQQTVIQMHEYLRFVDECITFDLDYIDVRRDIMLVIHDFEHILAMVQASADAVHLTNRKLIDLGKKL